MFLPDEKRRDALLVEDGQKKKVGEWLIAESRF
jgi:hypothetical protein